MLLPLLQNNQQIVSATLPGFSGGGGGRGNWVNPPTRSKQELSYYNAKEEADIAMIAAILLRNFT